LTVTAGNNQFWRCRQIPALALSVQRSIPTPGQPVVGAAISFSAVPTGGTFGSPTAHHEQRGHRPPAPTLSPPNPAPLPSPHSGDSPSTTTTAYFGETANVGPATSLVLVSGGKQRAPSALLTRTYRRRRQRYLRQPRIGHFSKFRRQRGRQPSLRIQ